jgi:hypothetical protein
MAQCTASLCRLTPRVYLSLVLVFSLVVPYIADISIVGYSSRRLLCNVSTLSYLL